MDTSVATKDVSLDDFEKDIDKALSTVDEKAVRVHRGAGQGDLVVTTEDRLNRQIEAVRSVGRVITATLKGSSKADALASEFPWASALPEPDADMFFAELRGAIDIEGPEQTVDTLLVLLDQWKNTAEAWADEDTLDALTTALEDHGPVTA